MMDALALYVTTLIPQFFSDSSRSAQNAVENMTLTASTTTTPPYCPSPVSRAAQFDFPAFHTVPFLTFRSVSDGSEANHFGGRVPYARKNIRLDFFMEVDVKPEMDGSEPSNIYQIKN